MKKDDRKLLSQRVWKLHEARAHFSELFRRVRAEGAQRVIKQGGEEVVIMRAEEYDQLTHRRSQPISLVEFFRSAPAGAEELDVKRKADVTRTLSMMRPRS